MTDPLRIALVGAWHVHADDYARDCANNPDSELVVVWDDDAARGRAAGERWGIPYTSDLESVLTDPTIEGIIVTTATVQHRDVLSTAARSGKHIYTEKVLAPDPVDAEAIVQCVCDAGVVLTVSLPRLSAGYTRSIGEVIDRGELGTIGYVRVRVSHDGAVPRDGRPQWLPEHFFDRDQAAGGAMIDFGAHPYYLVHHFAGEPDAVTASFLSSSGHEVDDQAIVVCHYPGRLQGVAEASFLSRTAGFQIDVHGENGSIRFDDGDLRIRTIDDASWRPLEIPADDPTPFDRWVTRIRTGQPDDDNVKAALALTRMAAAAEKSAVEGRTVRLERP